MSLFTPRVEEIKMNSSMKCHRFEIVIFRVYIDFCVRTQTDIETDRHRDRQREIWVHVNPKQYLNQSIESTRRPDVQITTLILGHLFRTYLSFFAACHLKQQAFTTSLHKTYLVQRIEETEIRTSNQVSNFSNVSLILL